MTAPAGDKPPLSARARNRALLARQGLLVRTASTPEDAMAGAVALQAQDPVNPYLALWNRVKDFRASDLDRAYQEGTLVRATLMRVTIHVVLASDYRPFHDAMQETLRAARLHDRRYRDTGLTPADADTMSGHLLAHAAEPRSGAELEAFLGARLDGRDAAWAWWALRQVAPLLHVPGAHPWAFRVPRSYRAAPDRGDHQPADGPRHLARRYVEGFGPASHADLAQFGLLRASTARAALAQLSGDVEVIPGPAGPLLDVHGAPRPPEETPAPPRLLGMWDEILLAHRDRSIVVDPAWRPAVIRRNGDTLPALLVDGMVTGVWRPVDGGIEVTSFRRLTGADWRSIEAEAASLLAFLAPRDPRPFTRYARWYEDLPDAERRIVGG